MLIEPTPSFATAVFLSKDFLNCPKFILNHTLDCYYRQFYDNPTKAVEVIAKLLTKYKFANPIKTAREFVEWREGIKMAEFDELNVNSYINLVPDFIEKRHKHICDWIDRHTTEVWCYDMLLSKDIPTYPYKNYY